MAFFYPKLRTLLYTIKGSLEKLLVPLPSLEEQIQLSSEYEKVKTVDFYHRYANPIIEQYDSLMNFFWTCYN